MFKKKVKQAEAQSAGDEFLKLAFERVDQTVTKLDALKASYNETASKLSEAPPKLAAVPVPPPSYSSSRGRYKGPVGEQTSIPLIKPGVPRPDKKPAPPKTRSGRYFVQVSDTKNADDFRKMREQISKAGRIVDSGQGTASNPDAGWMEVAIRAEDTSSFMLKLEELEVDKTHVEKVIEVLPGEGRIQARQLDLFRKKQDSQSNL